jgi:hypothetical protein
MTPAQPAPRERVASESEEAVDVESLNFKVSSRFKREFKGFAVDQGITMVELLKEGFELSKQHRLGKLP